MNENKSSFSINEFKNFIIQWNNQFPLDYWWRKKYNIPFNSEKHRAISILDIAFEFHEEKIIKKSVLQEERYKKNLLSIKSTGKILIPSKTPKITEEEIDDWFNDLNI